MKVLNQEQHDSAVEKIGDYLANNIFPGVYSFILFAQDGEGDGHIIHSDKQELGKMADAAAWMAISLSQGFKQHE